MAFLFDEEDLDIPTARDNTGSLYRPIIRCSSLRYHSCLPLLLYLPTCALRAQVSFFDTNPAGRILNRFSKDIGCIDELLPKTFLQAIQLILFLFTAGILPSFTNAWLCLVFLPVIIVFPYLTLNYLKTSRELKRLESICRSPVYSHFSETMAGLDTIRTRKKEQDFIDQLYR